VAEQILTPGLACNDALVISRGKGKTSRTQRVILATQDAEIRRINVPSQPGQIVLETLS
jgi:hypothetical protein